MPANEGARTLRDRLKDPRIRRIVLFGVVGFSGVFVNLAVSEALFRAVLLAVESETTRLAVANALGVVVSIFTNFLLNDRWTWGDRSKGGRKAWFARLAKYYVAASVAGVIQVGVASLTFDYLWSELPVSIFGIDLDSTLAICTGIGAGMFINFVASHYWAFRDADET